MKLMSINLDPVNNMRSMLICSIAIMIACMSCSTVSVPMGDAIDAYTIKIERTACMGNCPVYAMTIHGDGTLEYEGFMNTPYKGRRIGSISKDSISALLRTIESIDINALQHQYTQQSSTDMPSVVFTVQHQKQGVIRGKNIIDYQGDATAPEALRLLYNRLDAWYTIIQWQ